VKENLVTTHNYLTFLVIIKLFIRVDRVVKREIRGLIKFLVHRGRMRVLMEVCWVLFGGR